MDSRIIHENRIEKDRVQRITQEVFGDYPQPRLEFAQYKVGCCYKLSTVINIFSKEQKLQVENGPKKLLLIHLSLQFHIINL